MEKKEEEDMIRVGDHVVEKKCKADISNIGLVKQRFNFIDEFLVVFENEPSEGRMVSADNLKQIKQIKEKKMSNINDARLYKLIRKNDQYFLLSNTSKAIVEELLSGEEYSYQELADKIDSPHKQSVCFCKKTCRCRFNQES